MAFKLIAELRRNTARGMRHSRGLMSPSNIVHHIDHFWCDPKGLQIGGWIFSRRDQIRSLRVIVGPDSREVSAFTERPDVLAAFPAFPHARLSGFFVTMDCQPCVPLQFEVATSEGICLMPVELPRHTHSTEVTAGYPDTLFDNFMAGVNRHGATVLEIGARKAHPLSVSHRSMFVDGCRYIGMDIHAAPNVDLVGDAHQLSSLLTPNSVDGIFSKMVFEHIAMPWQVAAQINRVLKPGGLVYHAAPQSWPVHEQPNDFWRYTDEGLKVLFGPAFGYEVIGAAMDLPLRISAISRCAVTDGLELHPSYGCAIILSRKVSEVDIHGTVDAGQLRQQAEQYPLRHFT